MTKDELDAIRARYADEPLLGEMRTDRFGKLITVTREHPVHTLLAEVERVTAERDAFMALETSYREQITDLNHRVNQAFRRGVAAMREAAVMAVPGHYVCQIIAHLPEPEDK